MNPERQNGSKNPQWIDRKLEYFREMLSATTDTLAGIKQPSPKQLEKLLDHRRQRIDAIIRLDEESGARTAETEGSEEIERANREIAGIARQLCELDARILEVLTSEKLKTVREIGQLGTWQKSNNRSGSQPRPRIVDIYQN